MPTSTSARKSDAQKLRYDLIPVRPLEAVARVYTLGAAKYDDRNWEKGLAWGRIYAAMQRHANAFWGGERYDQEDGQEHLASLVWGALALLEYQHTHPELDDRCPTLNVGDALRSIPASTPSPSAGSRQEN